MFNMAIERKFVKDAISRLQVADFLEGHLDRAGFSAAEIQRTPVMTRIAVKVRRPGLVIGHKGKSVRDLTDTLKTEFKIENPQIDVVEVQNADLDPRLTAKRVAKMVEMGKNVRRILHSVLKTVMDAGALGAEIVVSGKIVGKGGRAKSTRVFAGYLPKAGEPSRLVARAHFTGYPKSGAVGVQVSIVLPGTTFPDKETTKPVELPRVIEAAETAESVETGEKAE